MRWFRLYSDIIDDEKVNKMSLKLFKFFIFALGLASESEKNGEISLTIKDISWRLRISEKAVRQHLDELEGLKIITVNPAITITNWKKRQFISDNATQRSRDWRNKK